MPLPWKRALERVAAGIAPRPLSACCLVLSLAATVGGQARLTLEIRVFQGAEEVTGHSRVTVHRSGERTAPVATIAGGTRTLVQVEPGLYDAQAIREGQGRALDIRWAERMVVMAYPDEAGHHLEVINLATGYGALQVRASASIAPTAEIALLSAGQPGQSVEFASATATPNYVLFVVPGGQYDIRITRGARVSWHRGINVPVDRTRLWIAP